MKTHLLIIATLILACSSWCKQAQAQPASIINPSMSASWYNPQQAGHGIMIHMLDESTPWMCWFTFDLDGKPAWICALGVVDGNSMVFENAFVVEGGNFPPLFDPEQIVEVPWGSIIVTFASCDDANMEWTTGTTGFQSGSMRLQRLTSLWGAECVDSPDEVITPG
jgi:hypothetical protein